ncbi:hypothetical protein, partial [Burkholderia sp. Ac-20379]|uniref:hypothetical protein n=1 Tax=Burkholderia sp. Ac-20379 TaxID=2703900 RepID=UPI00197EAEAE
MTNRQQWKAFRKCADVRPAAMRAHDTRGAARLQKPHRGWNNGARQGVLEAQVVSHHSCSTTRFFMRKSMAGQG